jgi:hypothetical protein
MVDIRGGAKISEHKLANGNTQVMVTHTSKAYPNPARRGAQVRMTIPAAGNYAVRLVNLQGRVVLETTMENTDGDTLGVELPSTLPAGIYVLDAVSEETQARHQHKIIVQ